MWFEKPTHYQLPVHLQTAPPPEFFLHRRNVNQTNTHHNKRNPSTHRNNNNSQTSNRSGQTNQTEQNQSSSQTNHATRSQMVDPIQTDNVNPISFPTLTLIPNQEQQEPLFAISALGFGDYFSPFMYFDWNVNDLFFEK